MVSSLTGAERLMTAATVEIATPARRATSLIVDTAPPCAEFVSVHYTKRFVYAKTLCGGLEEGTAQLTGVRIRNVSTGAGRRGSTALSGRTGRSIDVQAKPSQLHAVDRGARRLVGDRRPRHGAVRCLGH